MRWPIFLSVRRTKPKGRRRYSTLAANALVGLSTYGLALGLVGDVLVRDDSMRWYEIPAALFPVRPVLAHGLKSRNFRRLRYAVRRVEHGFHFVGIGTLVLGTPLDPDMMLR